MTFADLAEKALVADFETAVHYAGYGKFQAILLVISGMIYATCAISTTTLSFVLPSAECDFNLTSMDKGKLSAMPLIGMIFGCGLWGYFADAKGRKWALTLALLFDFIAALVSSFAQSFDLFLVCRFFNGFGIIGATSIIFPYLGEFCSIKNRDSVLGRLEIFWNIGVILLPGLAWAILGHPMKNAGTFSSWRLFVFICGLPSLFSIFFLCCLPETPKYLISRNRYEHARMVFKKVFVWNTGKPANEYPVVLLEGEFENNNNSLKVEEDLRPRLHRVLDALSLFLDLLRRLCSQPYLKYLVITSFADFGLMASYYTLIMWFPEIFERFNQFSKHHPNETASVCTVSEGYSLSDEAAKVCDNSINTRVFLDTFIIGLSCIPTSVSLSFFMRKLGKKVVLICGLVLSGLSALALNWVSTTTQTLVLSCIFEALTSILEAVLFCVVVDLFPTYLRAIALAVTATSGRFGAIFGNMVFGMLIDINCIVPIHLFGFLLILSGILCLAVPHSDNYVVLHE